MSQPILGPLPPPLDVPSSRPMAKSFTEGKAANLFPAARGAKDLMRATSQCAFYILLLPFQLSSVRYTWQRRKQERKHPDSTRLKIHVVFCVIDP